MGRVKNKEEDRVLQEVIGLIPAAGQATRITPLPCSKELYPVGFRQRSAGGPMVPKVVCHYLLEKMQAAGIKNAYVVLRDGKWDIPAYLGNGTMFDMHLAYLMVNRPTCGVPYTLDEAYPFVQDKLVALGLPDVLFQSEDSFTRLLARQSSHSVDVVLGLSRADRPEKVDMVDIDDKGRVRGIVIKPNKTQLVYSWIIALWKPRFTHFMHEYLAAMSGSAGEQSELFLGDILEAAISCGLSVEGVPVSDDSCLDIGTPEDLRKAVKDFAVQYP